MVAATAEQQMAEDIGPFLVNPIAHDRDRNRENRMRRKPVLGSQGSSKEYWLQKSISMEGVSRWIVRVGRGCRSGWMSSSMTVWLSV